MTAPLLTPTDLGALLNGLDATTVEKLRKRHHWPHVRISRVPLEIRYTEEQAAQIVAQHSVAPTLSNAPATRVPGQTPRSAARRRSA
jgi:hypothetical protein